jgi:hypothetical protein
MKHERSRPLADQLARAARLAADPTTRHLFITVRSSLDDRIENFFVDPSSDNLQGLVGFWTRAVRLLKETPDIVKDSEAM